MLAITHSQVMMKLIIGLFLCLPAGTMVWGIDFQVDPSNEEPVDNMIEDFSDISARALADHELAVREDPVGLGTPFTGFDRCTLEKNIHIRTAWDDVVKLVEKPSKFNLGGGLFCSGICSAGVLEKRIWGDDVSGNNDAIKLIRKIYTNIKELPLVVDGGRIRITCGDVAQIGTDVPLWTQPSCNKLVSGAYPDAYVFYVNHSGNDYSDSTIVLCASFFADYRKHLGELVQFKKDHPSEQKNPLGMKGKAHILLHELSHVPGIANKQDTLIIDQLWTEYEVTPQRVYGVRAIERFAKAKGVAKTSLNADNYAWYANLKYFEALFGTPNAYNEGRREPEEPPQDPPAKPTKALNIVFEEKRKGSGPVVIEKKWLFYSVPYGTASDCQANPPPVAEAPVADGIRQSDDKIAPAGTFNVKTQDGDCQYKNDGNGNAGALWCGDKAHACNFYGNPGGIQGGDTHGCSILSDGTTEWGSFGFWGHRSVVNCEW